jgi:phosphatidylglycerol:prolipoprotein diacylglycerol transferase
LAFPAGSPASYEQAEAGLLADKALASLPVHPTQLYEALGCLGIAAWLLLVTHPRKRFDGQVMLLFLIDYAILRFLLEYLRADDRGSFFGFSTSQWIGLASVLLAAIAYPQVRKHSRKQSAVLA